MNYIRNIILFLLGAGLTAGCASAQSPLNEKEAMQVILSRFLINNDLSNKCDTINLSFSIISISFDRKGQVAEVKTSNLPPCVEAMKERMQEEITEECNKLSSQTKGFRNKYVLVLLFFSKEGKAHYYRTLNESFLAIYNSTSKLSGGRKELKYVLPVTCRVYP